MFRHLVACAALLFAANCTAHQLTGSSSDSARLGSKVISAGDSRARVIDAAGEPLFEKAVYRNREVKLGQRLFYRSGNNRHTVIQFDLNDKVIWARDVIGQLSDVKQAD
ncbi:uncharacterized protein DUF2845 [Tahibacter aquaticus]|jgi:hypothetical protein|uniref:Uncharacterized protein DUF2845 n=1 Tax=Tahibacter aquaticus TaxID=520092 RepID=A0A4R6YQ68_9GAMM|nr:DUF2845 domain-containing protein [Tahibacter aquaticus]TDR39993.1 uncharacterized protein DUF2845 [Tahibacter aquaticus]